MSEILTGTDGPLARREPTGGWIAPLVVVVVVALLASGVLSSDPEPDAAAGPAAVPAQAPASAASPAASSDPASLPATDDQADFVEFGFDSQLGVLAPRGEPAASAPAAHPGEGKRPARPM